MGWAPFIVLRSAGPGLDVLRRLALALSVSADMLLFDDGERDPDDELRLQFQAVKRLDPDERAAIKN